MKRTGYNSRMETKNAFLRLTASLLVGFFARARASVLAVVVAAAAGGGLAACGGGGGDGIGNVGNDRNDRNGGGAPVTSRAYFLGANRVVGLQYQYENGGSGVTGARGSFPRESGQTVVFSVGQTRLGTLVFSSDEERDIVTPLRIVGDSGGQTARETRALRVDRLLTALDDSTNSAEISIPAAALTSTMNLLEITQLEDAGEEIGAMVDGLTLNIPSTNDAHFELFYTNNCIYSGSFAGRTPNGNTVAFVLMPSYYGGLTVTNVVTLANASPAISFIRDESGVQFDETALTIDLKIPPLEATLGGGVMTLASYDRIEFGGGTMRRVAGDPNADIRLVGVYSADNGKGPFVADIFDAIVNTVVAQGAAEISDIRDPNFRNLLSATWMGGGMPGDTTIWTLQENILAYSATLTVSPSPVRRDFLNSGGGISGVSSDIFGNASDGLGGNLCAFT